MNNRYYIFVVAAAFFTFNSYAMEDQHAEPVRHTPFLRRFCEHAAIGFGLGITGSYDDATIAFTNADSV